MALPADDAKRVLHLPERHPAGRPVRRGRAAHVPGRRRSREIPDRAQLLRRAACPEYYEENPDGYAERFASFNHVVENEDYWVAASVQANAASGIQTHILFGRNEPGLHHYHNAHRRGLKRPLLELEPA